MSYFFHPSFLGMELDLVCKNFKELSDIDKSARENEYELFLFYNFVRWLYKIYPTSKIEQIKIEMRNTLFERNLALALSFLRSCYPSMNRYNLEPDNIFAEFNVKLLLIIDKFDYNRNLKFSTFAYKSLSNVMAESINEIRGRKKITVNMTDLESESYCKFKQSAPILLDLKTSPSNSFDKINFEDVMAKLNSLSERTKIVVLNRCGFYGKPKTLKEIGNEIGLTGEMVRIIEKKGINRIKKFFGLNNVPSVEYK